MKTVNQVHILKSNIDMTNTIPRGMHAFELFAILSLIYNQCPIKHLRLNEPFETETE